MMTRAFGLMYEHFLGDLRARDERSCIFRHHIARIDRALSHYGRAYDWESVLDQTVVDYIASMTDGYFTELACALFPSSSFPIARTSTRVQCEQVFERIGPFARIDTSEPPTERTHG